MGQARRDLDPEKVRGKGVEKSQLGAMLSAWEHQPSRAEGAFSWKVISPSNTRWDAGAQPCRNKTIALKESALLKLSK